MWAQRGWTVVWVIAGSLLSILTAPLLLGLVRDRLHVRCEADPSFPDSFVCADGIGYIESGATLMLVTAVSAVVAGLVVFLVPARTTRTAVLVAVTILGLAWALLATWGLVGRSHDPHDAAEYWIAALAPAAIILAVASATAAVSLLVPRPRGRVLGLGLAAVLVVLATFAQPGLAICTLTAAGILAAAAAGTSGSVEPRREPPIPARRR